MVHLAADSSSAPTLENEAFQLKSYAANRSDEANQLMRTRPIGSLVLQRAREDWPRMPIAEDHPDFPRLSDCRFEIEVARRGGTQDQVSVVIRFPEEFPLRSSNYSVDLDRGTIAGSDKRVLGNGSVLALRMLALGAE